MTLLYSVAAGDAIQAADVNQFKNMLEGASGYTSTFVLVSTTGANFIVKMGDAAGATKFALQDSAGVEQWSVNSDGLVSGGSIAPTTFTFPVSASPSQTTDGQAVWDSDDNVLTVGDGAATKQFGYLGASTPAVIGTASNGSGMEVARVNHVHGATNVWVEISGGAITNAASINLASLSGYVRYRLSLSCVTDNTNTGLSFVGKINGGSAHTANRIRVSNTTVTGQLDSAAATFTICDANSGAVGGLSYGTMELEVFKSSAASGRIGFLFRGHTQNGVATDSVSTVGGGNDDNVVASITAINIAFGSACSGYYFLEGSNG